MMRMLLLLLLDAEEAAEAAEAAGKKLAMMVAEDDGEMKLVAACWKADAIRAVEEPNFGDRIATHTS